MFWITCSQELKSLPLECEATGDGVTAAMSAFRYVQEQGDGTSSVSLYVSL